MAKSTWEATNIPDQQDRVIIVTGSTSGIGKEAARVLAGKNATVVMAVRNTEKGEKVAQEFRKARIAPPKMVLSFRWGPTTLVTLRWPATCCRY